MSSASATPLLSRTRLVASVTALALAGAGLVGPMASSARAQEVVVEDVTIVPSQSAVATGFVTLTVQLALTSDEPLPSSIIATFGNDATVLAKPTDGRDARLGPEWLPTRIAWGELTLTSGTATDGVWTAATEVSPYWNGTWRATQVDLSLGTAEHKADVTAFDATVDLGTTSLPTWALQRVLPEPVKVVTGDELWAPGARIVDRTSGTPIAGFFTYASFFADWGPPARLPSSSSLDRAGADGYGAASARPVDQYTPEGSNVYAYASRGSRGYSLEAVLCVGPHVKWQANERVSTSGRTVTVTGNAWPAPSIFAADNPSINLQVWTGSRWATPATSRVRDNGRYTLTWTAPTAGTYQVRAYKPGQISRCTSSVGSVLPAVDVTLP